MIHGLMEAAETEVSSVQKADSLWQIHIYIQMDSDRTATEFMCHSACCRPDLRPKQVGGGGGWGGRLHVHHPNRLTTDLQWGLQLQEDGLAQEDFPGL